MSDSQATLGVLTAFKLVSGRLTALLGLAQQGNSHASAREGIETADRLAGEATRLKFVGSEPFFETSRCYIKKCLRTREDRNVSRAWSGLAQTFIKVSRCETRGTLCSQQIVAKDPNGFPYRRPLALVKRDGCSSFCPQHRETAEQLLRATSLPRPL